jgi:hypothetical protein
MCPDLPLCDEKQKVMRNWMLSQDAIGSCFANTGYVNAPTDIYDESMTRKQGWIFYGESKPNIPPYMLKYVYKYNPTQDTWEDENIAEYSSRQLMELLSVRYNIEDDENVVREEERHHYEAMKMWGETMTATPPPPEAPAELDPNPGATLLDAIQAIYGTDLGEEEKKIVRRLVMECLSTERAENYEKWIRVGWCLHNISPSEENFQLWMDFSARSRKSSSRDRTWNGWTAGKSSPTPTSRRSTSRSIGA